MVQVVFLVEQNGQLHLLRGELGMGLEKAGVNVALEVRELDEEFARIFILPKHRPGTRRIDSKRLK